MTVRNFERLLEPRSVALIGASTRPGSVGLITAQNLLQGGFAGPIVVKTGRSATGAKAALSHTGALAGADAAYDAAFRRSGLLRVQELDDLFSAAEMLARHPRLAGDRLAILTNGGGAGVMATDHLGDRSGTLAALSEGTLAALDAVLPPTWSRGNPVDIIGDAGGALPCRAGYPPRRAGDGCRADHQLFYGARFEHTTMLQMCRQLGFSVEPERGDATLRSVVLPLQ